MLIPLGMQFSMFTTDKHDLLNAYGLWNLDHQYNREMMIKKICQAIIFLNTLSLLRLDVPRGRTSIGAVSPEPVEWVTLCLFYGDIKGKGFTINQKY